MKREKRAENGKFVFGLLNNVLLLYFVVIIRASHI